MKHRRLNLLAVPLLAFGVVTTAHAEIVARMITIHIDQTGVGFEKNMD